MKFQFSREKVKISQEKKFSIDFSKASKRFYLSLCYNAGNSYLFVNGKEIFENVNSSAQFVSEVYLMDLVLISVEEYL